MTKTKKIHTLMSETDVNLGVLSMAAISLAALMLATQILLGSAQAISPDRMVLPPAEVHAAPGLVGSKAALLQSSFCQINACRVTRQKLEQGQLQQPVVESDFALGGSGVNLHTTQLRGYLIAASLSGSGEALLGRQQLIPDFALAFLGLREKEGDLERCLSGIIGAERSIYASAAGPERSVMCGEDDRGGTVEAQMGTQGLEDLVPVYPVRPAGS